MATRLNKARRLQVFGAMTPRTTTYKRTGGVELSVPSAFSAQPQNTDMNSPRKSSGRWSKLCRRRIRLALADFQPLVAFH